MKRLLMAAVAALSFNLAAAVELAGVKFDDKIHVGTGDLVVNGAGLRKKAVLPVATALRMILPGFNATIRRPSMPLQLRHPQRIQ